MSNPINPLSKYRSYNYQQMLILCDTTETAEKLSSSNRFLDFTRSKDADRVNTPDDPYAKYKPYNIELTNGRSGKYIILIDGTRDAEFRITKANWYNTVAAPAGGVGNETGTYNAGGEMQINEPQGIRFMNVLTKAADSLGSDPNAVICMLKTIFIGHATATYADDDFPDPITNIKPMMFLMSGITGSFTITGGDYTVEFAGINHGVTKQPQIIRSNDRIKIDTSLTEGGCEANTLSGAMCKLQNQIRVIYKKYYNEIKSKIESMTDDNGNPVKFNGREVTYVIKAVDPLNGPDYLVTDFHDAATNTGETGKGGIIELAKETSVEAAILAIAKRCPKVQEDLVVGEGSNTRHYRYIPKVATTIETTDTEYKIVYTLRRVLAVRDDIVKILSQRTSDKVENLDDMLYNNLLELDYMYTGRNVDIIDFDLKMQMGLTFYQNLLTTENIPNAGQSTDGGKIRESTANKRPLNVVATYNGQLRPNTPIFLNTIVRKESIKHVTNPKRTLSFQEELNRHAALENVDAVVKIHGNPGLMDGVNPPPSRVAAGVTVNDKGMKVVGTSVFPYWEILPAIVKINIKMPSTYYGGASDSNDFSEPFWYNGYYYCYAVEQMFEEGEFTQLLHIVSIPKASPDDNLQTHVSETDQSSQTITANQNSKTSGSGTATTPGSTNTTSTSPADDPDNMTVDEYLRANSG